MTNILTFYFKGSDIQKLAKPDIDYVLVNSSIDVQEINGVKVGVIVVSATSYKKSMASDRDPVIPDETVGGCPVPPCVGGDGTVGPDCMGEVEHMFKSYESLNLL